MNDADSLFQQALEYMKREDYVRAKVCLKKAAALAPLRNDIRDTLIHALQETGDGDGGESNEPSETASRGAFRAPSTRGRSDSGLRKTILTFSALVLLVVLVFSGLGIAKRYGFQISFTRENVAGPSGPSASDGDAGTETLPSEAESVAVPSPSPTPTPSPTPEPVEARRETLRRSIETYAQAGQTDQALQAVLELLETDPPDREKWEERRARFYFDLGERAFKARDYQEAQGHFHDAIQVAPHVSRYYGWLGQTHYRMGIGSQGATAEREFRSAKEALLQSVKIDPAELGNYDTLARVYIKLGDSIAGADCYRQIIARAPNSPEAKKAANDLKSMGMM